MACPCALCCLELLITFLLQGSRSTESGRLEQNSFLQGVVALILVDCTRLSVCGFSLTTVLTISMLYSDLYG